ncbi:DsdX permease [Peribacillus simplex]|nr:DsdX permease [Peribacillus simplex]
MLVYALVSIIFLIVIKAKANWHPFIALLLAAFILGIIAGMDIPDVADAVQTGVGNTLD